MILTAMMSMFERGRDVATPMIDGETAASDGDNRSARCHLIGQATQSERFLLLLEYSENGVTVVSVFDIVSLPPCSVNRLLLLCTPDEFGSRRRQSRLLKKLRLVNCDLYNTTVSLAEGGRQSIFVMRLLRP
jgi:hypothetical protein